MEWRPTLEFPDWVQVNDVGDVRYLQSLKPIKNHKNRFGYLQVQICRNGERYFRQVHVLVIEAFLSGRPDGFQVNHKNGIKSDNRLENLEWVTCKENRQHAADTGLWNNRGQDHHSAKLTESDVLDIRQSCERSGLLAEVYGVTAANIRMIRRRKTWAHVV